MNKKDDALKTIWLVEIQREFEEDNFNFLLKRATKPTIEEVVEYCRLNEEVVLDPDYCKIRITAAVIKGEGKDE